MNSKWIILLEISGRAIFSQGEEKPLTVREVFKLNLTA